MRAIEDLAQSLAAGQTTSRALVEEALSRIADPAGEGARTFIKVHAAQARAAADAVDAARRVGLAVGRYAGIPIALKDLFDIAGEPTPAGSKVLADAPAARMKRSRIYRGGTHGDRFHHSDLWRPGSFRSEFRSARHEPGASERGRPAGGERTGAGVGAAERRRDQRDDDEDGRHDRRDRADAPASAQAPEAGQPYGQARVVLAELRCDLCEDPLLVHRKRHAAPPGGRTLPGFIPLMTPWGNLGKPLGYRLVPVTL